MFVKWIISTPSEKVEKVNTATCDLGYRVGKSNFTSNICPLTGGNDLASNSRSFSSDPGGDMRLSGRVEEGGKCSKKVLIAVRVSLSTQWICRVRVHIRMWLVVKRILEMSRYKPHCY